MSNTFFRFPIRGDSRLKEDVMKQFVTSALLIGALCVSMAALTSRPVVAADVDQTLLQADRAFVQAVAKGDKTALGAILDPRFLWTDADGNTLTKAEVLQTLPTPTPGYEAQTKEYTYGQVANVRTDSGKLHVLRVWVKEPAEWRLLIYDEVKQAEKAGSGGGPIVHECINPCKSVPYMPKNDAEAGVLKSWGELETAVTAGDSKAWAPHFADEFEVINTGTTEPVTKAGRMAILDKQKQAGTNGAPAELAPGHTQMLTFGDTLVMSCQATPHSGKPSHITRVWVKRNGMWLMTVSFQTTIQAAPEVTAK